MAGKKRWMLETELFGRHVTFPYAEHWVGYALFVMRLVIGWVLFQAGFEKLLDPSWTATGYLTHAIPAGNPFVDLFGLMAGNPFVDQLVIWGFILTGIGVLFGAALRFSAFWASVMMLLLWMTHLHGGLLSGFPVEHGWFVTEHIVYIALLWGIAAFGAGQIFGVDGWLRKQGFVKKHQWLENILG